MAQTEKRTVEIVIKGQQANASIRDMESATRALRSQLNKLPKDSQEFADKSKEFQKINGALKKIKDDVNGVGGVFGKIGKEIKGFGILAAGYLGLDFVTSKIQDIIGQNAKLSDSLADIQKTTGMTSREAKNFNNALGQMDTRTASSELREIAIAAGQLGIAKNDVLKFTAATDKLVVALGDEFKGGAEEVTKQLGGLRNSFIDIKSDNISDDMLHIGNAINELGSSGAATGPVIADFSNRIGGVGITMGLTSGQVLGLSATLQELNVNAERGGTAVVKILQKMSSNTADFAKVAGMPVKEFTNLVNKDLFGAFVKVSEGAKKSGNNATALAGILDTLGVEGAGASEVFAKLGNNTDLLQSRVKLANSSLKDTTSIMAEFKTKNDTLGADIDKIGKGMASAFANSAISDGLKSITGWVASLFEKTNALSQSMEDERVQVNALVIELKSSNTTQERRVEIYEELKAINPEIVEGINKESINMALLTANIREYNKEQINRIALQIQQEEIDAAQKIAAEKGKKLSTDQIEAQKQLGKISKLNGEVGKKAKKIIDNETISTTEKVTQIYALAKAEEYRIVNGNTIRNKEAMQIQNLLSSVVGITYAEEKYAEATEEAAKQIELKVKMEEQYGGAIKKNTQATMDYTKLSIAELNKYIKLEKDSKGNAYQEEAALSKQELERRKNADKEIVASGDKANKELINAKKNFLDTMEKLEGDRYIRQLRIQHEEFKKAGETQKALLVELEIEEYEIFKKYEKLKAEDKKAGAHKEKELHLLMISELNDLYKTHPITYEVEAQLKPMQQMEGTMTPEQTKEWLEMMFGAHLTPTAEEDEKTYKQKFEAYKKYASDISKITSAANKLQDNIADRKLRDEKKSQEGQLALQKRLFDQKIISESEYNKRVEKINNQAEAKRIKIEREANMRKKRSATFETIINTASAIAEASPIVPLQLLAGITGALQLAAIHSEPVPFARGGRTIGTFSNGGRVNKPFLAMAGEAGPEWIAPSWMVESPSYGPTIAAMENVRARGYASGGSTVTSDVPKFNTSTSTSKSKSSDASGELLAAINTLNGILASGQIHAIINYDRWTKDMAAIEAAKSSSKS